MARTGMTRVMTGTRIAGRYAAVNAFAGMAANSVVAAAAWPTVATLKEDAAFSARSGALRATALCGATNLRGGAAR